MACVAAHGYTCDEFLVDVSDNVAPINPVIGEDTVEHILLTIKERPQRAAAIVRRIPDGEEREENHQLDNMDTGELAVGPLLESHLPFRNIYGLKYAHYPLNAESAAIFCKKIAQF